MPPDAAEELLVAVGEAVTNAVLHGGRQALSRNEGNDAGRTRRSATPLRAAGAATRRRLSAEPSDVVMVELLAHGDRVAVAVTSPSARWRVPQVGPPEPIADRGRGLYLMRHLADSVRVEQGRRGTTVYLIRRLPHGENG
jgi:anti-sigma regulatory factor (Ser/Thr protein kinase)